MSKNSDHRPVEAEGAEGRDEATETHLRIMVEQMVREGCDEESIERAVRQAA
jgi:hypothetical protein